MGLLVSVHRSSDSAELSRITRMLSLTPCLGEFYAGKNKLICFSIRRGRLHFYCCKPKVNVGFLPLINSIPSVEKMTFGLHLQMDEGTRYGGKWDCYFNLDSENINSFLLLVNLDLHLCSLFNCLILSQSLYCMPIIFRKKKEINQALFLGM